MSEWSSTMIKCFTGGGIRFVTYVPDKVLIPLIDGFQAHPGVTAFSATREEEAVGIPHVTLEREDEVEFLVTRTLHQCHRTQQPAALILSPRLTGGKMEG